MGAALKERDLAATAAPSDTMPNVLIMYTGARDGIGPAHMAKSHVEKKTGESGSAGKVKREALIYACREQLRAIPISARGWRFRAK